MPDVEKLRAAGNLKGLRKASAYRKDPALAIAAIEALAELGDVEGLGRALDEGTHDAKLAAVEALGRIGDEGAIAALAVAVLCRPLLLGADQEADIALAAAQALGTIRPAGAAALIAALDPLATDDVSAEAIARLEKHWHRDDLRIVRTGAAAAALGEIRWQPAAVVLAPMLAELDRAVEQGTRHEDLMYARKRIRYALEQIGPASTATMLGVRFDIGALERGSYGYEAFRVFFSTVDTTRLGGVTLNHGDTAATLAGTANEFCIAVVSPMDPSKIEEARAMIAASTGPGLLPPETRFIEEDELAREPLTLAARIDAGGNVVQDQAGWVTEAWRAANPSA